MAQALLNHPNPKPKISVSLSRNVVARPTMTAAKITAGMASAASTKTAITRSVPRR